MVKNFVIWIPTKQNCQNNVSKHCLQTIKAITHQFLDENRAICHFKAMPAFFARVRFYAEKRVVNQFIRLFNFFQAFWTFYHAKAPS